MIEEHNLNPADYQDLVEGAEQNLPTWFQRVHTTVPACGVIKILWDEFLQHSRAMADYYAKTDKPPPRSIGLHCSWCQYEKIYRAELQASTSAG